LFTSSQCTVYWTVFFSFFFFLISSFSIKFTRIELHNFFNFLLIFGLLWIEFHDLFQFIFYKVISVSWLASQVWWIILTWLKVFLFFLKYWVCWEAEFHNLFWFVFYEVILVSLPELWVWIFNPGWLSFFSQFHPLILPWLGIRFHNLF
jgi:hypothetical protein